GWHPEDVVCFNAKAEELLLEQLTDSVVVGIGEIGLDYFNDEHSPHDVQKQVFERQLAIARDLKMPVSIH
ncbi:TatD family hydrolase, partial [Mediterraneibacter sp. 210702-DFI.5.30]|uniref:TatD family hydrolase n=1 Tax=Mediterraneibacter sp. 210702-DFI.5.30 TaxID=2883232 RepID=UPI001D06BEB1